MTFLDSKEKKYYTFTPKDEKPINLVIKTLNSSFTRDDVLDAINELNLGLTILNIKVLQTRNNNNSWLLQLKNENNKHKSIMGKQLLCSSVVLIDLYKPNTLTQCRRCQRFNHSAINCKQEYRCVKCGKSEFETDEQEVRTGHSPSCCPLNDKMTNGKNDPINLFCCNCRQHGHTANYKKCPKYIELIERRNQKNEQSKEKTSSSHPKFQSFVEKGITFADKLTQSSQSSNQHTHRSRSRNKSSTREASVSNARPNNKSRKTIDSNSLSDDCNQYFGKDLFTTLAEIKKFIPQYNSFSAKQKPVKLLEFLFNITST